MWIWVWVMFLCEELFLWIFCVWRAWAWFSSDARLTFRRRRWWLWWWMFLVCVLDLFLCLIWLCYWFWVLLIFCEWMGIWSLWIAWEDVNRVSEMFRKISSFRWRTLIMCWCWWCCVDDNWISNYCLDLILCLCVIVLENILLKFFKMVIVEIIERNVFSSSSFFCRASRIMRCILGRNFLIILMVWICNMWDIWILCLVFMCILLLWFLFVSRAVRVSCRSLRRRFLLAS